MNIFKIKEKLSEYSGFDMDLIFNNTDFLVVFGGAIRDIIQGIDVDKINDIDILCLPESKHKAIQVLTENGYVENGFIKKNLHSIYKDIKYIFEPSTFFKGTKVIQLITPSSVFRPRNLYQHIKNGSGFRDKSKKLYDDMTIPYYDLLANVDISSSGTFYDGETLYESVDDSIIHCQRRVYRVNDKALMYNYGRTMTRVEKLKSHGWNDIDDAIANGDMALERILKLHKLLCIYPPNIDDFKDKMFRKFV
jgi:hypothetical protein